MHHVEVGVRGGREGRARERESADVNGSASGGIRCGVDPSSLCFRLYLFCVRPTGLQQAWRIHCRRAGIFANAGARVVSRYCQRGLCSSKFPHRALLVQTNQFMTDDKRFVAPERRCSQLPLARGGRLHSTPGPAYSLVRYPDTSAGLLPRPFVLFYDGWKLATAEQLARE